MWHHAERFTLLQNFCPCVLRLSIGGSRFLSFTEWVIGIKGAISGNPCIEEEGNHLHHAETNRKATNHANNLQLCVILHACEDCRGRARRTCSGSVLLMSATFLCEPAFSIECE